VPSSCRPPFIACLDLYMRIVYAPIMIVMLLAFGNARAADEDGASGTFWHKICVLNRGVTNDALCSVYVAGISEGYMAATVMHKSPPVYCLAGSISSAQMADIFRKALRTKPETRHCIASAIFLRAMAENHPCKGH